MLDRRIIGCPINQLFKEFTLFPFLMAKVRVKHRLDQDSMNYFVKTRAFFILFFSLILSTLTNLGWCGVLPSQSTVIAEFDVSSSSTNVFSTPIAWFNGAIYTVLVEDPSGSNNGINLRTVIKKGVIDNKGNWKWTTKVIEERTLEDKYHTQPSVGIDESGYIHVAYNMHNMPWQYKVSKEPEDISEFKFLGDLLTLEELSIVKHQNRTPFPQIGSAAIPGTQITYPAFFNDRKGNLYVTYRFATRPKRNWVERGFAGGVGRYNKENKEWQNLGGTILITTDDADLPEGIKEVKIPTFAISKGWSAYLIMLFFDQHNGMHLSWTWREGGAGSDCSHPSYAFSPDQGASFYRANGTKYKLPIGVADADVVSAQDQIEKFYAPTCLAFDPLSQPHVLLNPIGAGRFFKVYNNSENIWKTSSKSPFGATKIFIDDNGTSWAFATGLRVFERRNNLSKWKEIFSKSDNFGYPKIKPVPEERGFLVHCHHTDGNKVRIYWIKTPNMVFLNDGMFSSPMKPLNLRLNPSF